MAAIEYRGLNAVTNFDLSRYIKWLKPDNTPNPSQPTPGSSDENLAPNPDHDHGLRYVPVQSTPEVVSTVHQPRRANATSALGLLLQSSKFREMMEMTSAADRASPPPPPRESSGTRNPKCSFPEDVQTYFECQESSSFEEGDSIIFGDLNAFAPPLFQCDLFSTREMH